MNKDEFKDKGLEHLTVFEMKRTGGGSAWYAFIAGAIAGGMIYDAWKTSLNAYVNGCMNGSISPAIRPSR